MSTILELKNVSFTAQNARIIQQVSLCIEEGKTVALAGPSGCGKSTLLKICAGLIIPSAGEVRWKDISLVDMNRAQNLEFRRESAFVFQDSALWANQSLQQILELPLRIHFPGMSKTERDHRIGEVMRAVGCKRNLLLRPASLSMGEQKLVAFGRAMLCKPRLLFLDEWTESLDDYSARLLVSLVKQQKLNHNTIIFISHNMEILRDLADYVIMLVGGKTYIQLTHEQITADRELAEILEKGMHQ